MNNSVYILKDRAILYVNGQDARDFLQNLISSDINKAVSYTHLRAHETV